MNLPDARSARVPRSRHAGGFTLVEMVITLTILAAVILTLTTVIYTAARSKTATSNSVESSQAARVALDMMSRDLRSAGYGADLDYTANPQPPIAYVDSVQVLISLNATPYPDTAVVRGAPLAYTPTGNPKPFPLDGTAWQPPIRYRTGAEIVRWTLDLNNDGDVTVADLADANGIDAQRTPNPDDYELVRQVYGDSTALAAGNNGGTTERVALVRLPGGTVPPIFTVYMKGSAQPYDWANGPVPAAELRNIARVVVRITSPSGRPDWKGRFAESSFRSEVNSLRNIPDFGADLYAVDGYVFDDQNSNGTKNGGSEPGIAGATVRLGNYSTTTPASGYFVFNAPAGTYKLWHTPAVGYARTQNPDTVTVTVGPGTSHDFPDAAQQGGSVRAFVYVDADNDTVHDAGEAPRSFVKLTMTPGGQIAYTDAYGWATLWGTVGAWSVTATPPDSYIVTTANPRAGTMADGDSASIQFGIYQADVGTVSGTVYRDNNRNGVKDTGETGIENVWVAVTPDGGSTVPGYQYTDASGNYSLTVPVNDPPRTTPYGIMCVPPTGFFPTSTTTINPVWITSGSTQTDKNFGMGSFTVITLNASRVLSLGSANMFEKDYSGPSSKAKNDADIVLGADASGTDQITVWFNQWNSSPLFANTFSSTSDGYTRSAPASVLSQSLNYLDTTSPDRADLVTGTGIAAAGNFFVWFAQSSSGNEGFYKSTYDAGQNYRTTDNGDVQAVVTLDCAGGASADKNDIVVGTKSPTANLGSIEVWKSNNAATNPTFSRDETYTTFGTLIGEVTAMAASDFDGDGMKDLVFCTKTGSYSGQVVFYKGANKSTTPHFTFAYALTFATDAFTSLAVVDVDGDGLQDVVVGSQTGITTGKLRYLRNLTSGTFVFSNVRTLDAPGIVTSLASADFGGTSRGDLAMGFRTTSTGFNGGVRIYFLDSGTLPSSGTDPSAGSITNWVPAVNTNNFNFGANPDASAPFLQDLACGTKITATTGALVVFIR